MVLINCFFFTTVFRIEFLGSALFAWSGRGAVEASASGRRGQEGVVFKP